MTFSEQLNAYLTELNCPYSELANRSGLSSSAISRYCSGNRIPKYKSEAITQLARGIVAVGTSRQVTLSEEEVIATLSSTLNRSVYTDFSEHFDLLINSLSISLSDLSKNVNFDSSYLSRIRKGQRTPANIDVFVSDLCRYVVHKYTDEESLDIICYLTKCSRKQLDDPANYYTVLLKWFCDHLENPDNKMEDFLKHLNDFDLNEYIRSIRFDELKVPSVPFQFPTSKHYYGLEQMKQGELDFFKGTVLSKNMEPIFMCNDMPMDDLAEDVEFGKKWMFAIAMSIKKGLHINIIHNIHRPFNEMMLGLESWIPIYMTGQVSPYHLKNAPAEVYQHLNYSSGYMALTGECIDGYHAEGKYYLTSNKEEVAYYRKKCDRLLSKALPLMDIYTENEKAKFREFILTTTDSIGERRNILSSLPLYTMPMDLLAEILSANDIQEADCKRIKDYVALQKEQFAQILERDVITDEFSLISEKEFTQNPLMLPLAGIFYEGEIAYSYEQYQRHLKQTQALADATESYNFITSNTPGFRNILISIVEDRWVLISKCKSPTIHFVIRHPKMVTALSNFIMPVIEEK